MALAGALPNVHWQALSAEELRRHPAFEGLPPVDALDLRGRPSYRYIRQEDPLWSALHQGVLTTGYLPQTLGFFEPASARKLGLPKSRVSHRLLLDAYAHLLCPPYCPGRAANAGGGAGAAQQATAAEAAAEGHNAQAVARFNAGKLEPGAAQGQQGEQQQEQPPWQGDPAVLAWTPASAPHTPAPISPGGKAAGKKGRRRGRGGAAQGAGASGSLAAALGSAAALDALAAVAASGAAAATAGPHSADPLEQLKLRTARSLGQQGHAAICCAWGKVQEPASLLALAATLPSGARLVEVGLCQLAPADLPPEWGFAEGALPMLGASPDALLRYSSPAAAAAAAAAVSGARPTESTLELGLGELQLGGPPEPSPALLNGTSCSGSNSDVARPSSKGGGSGSGILEVVEVKNACPFGVNQRRRGCGRPAAPYLVSDKGPRQSVKPEWVPQLQMHMLCAGAHSALLVSRSATKGMHAFRMPRDDAYLLLMLRVVSRVWREYVLPGRPPPPDMFASWAEYHALLRHTLELAHAAPLVLAVAEPHHPPCGDSRFFLD